MALLLLVLVMNILIALDGSDFSRNCIEDLVYFLNAPDSHVHLIVVSDESLLAAHQINQSQAKEILNAAKDLIGRKFPGTNLSGEIKEGNAQTQITQSAQEFEADLIMVGAHAPRPFHRELLGSVATHLARNATCSIRLKRHHSNDNRILVCLENSEIDRSVLNGLKKMYFPLGSLICFLHVINSQTAELSKNPHIDAQLYAEKQSRLKVEFEETAKTYAKELLALYPKLEIETAISPEVDAEAVIIEKAKSWRATTIIMGSHRREGLDRLFMGSVSEPVSAAAPCSAHIIRHTQILHV